MQTTYRFFSGIAETRCRLAMLAATFVAATVGWSTPATAAVTGLTMGPQTGALYTGTAGSVTYDLTLSRNSSYPSDSSTVRWTFAADLPTGVTASVSPLSAWSGTTRAYRMTISTSAATPAATSPFTLTATPSLAGQGSGSATGSLLVQAAVQAAQSISFGAIANRTVGDASFNVSATASSGLPVSITTAPATVCSNTGKLVNVVGVGTCTVTAKQAGNASYLPAPDVLRDFTVAAGSTVTPTFDLYATPGTVMLPGGAVPIWAYSSAASAPTSPGGPTLTVAEGASVTVSLHNQLPVDTAVLFQGQTMVPDTTGAAPGTTKTYTFVAGKPGTYLYEAGLLTNAQHQVAMGLHGALVVTPASPAPANQAYGDASTAFDEQQVLVLSEIDPLLNFSIDPATFDMREFSPRYFLINGQVYPGTVPIATLPGHKVLLRYVNAGVQHHSMAVLGLRQNFIAKDGNPLKTGAQSVTAETLAAGQTGDAIATVPATAAADSRFAVYDASLKLHNDGDGSSFGGMLTFVTVGGTPGTGDTLGPLTSGLSVDGSGILSANVSDVGRGSQDGSAVTAAEYFLDTTKANGTGLPMGPTSAPAPMRNFSSAAPLSGSHTVFVHGRDAANNWGPFQVLVISSDTTGPTTSALALAPNPTNGTVDVLLTGTANDTATGGSNISAAEYQIDGGTFIPMVVSPVNAAKIAGLSATIPAAAVAALSNGPHTVSVHSLDSASPNWGPTVSVTLNVNKSVGPVTTGVSASPNPNNGAKPLSATQPVVRVTATVTCPANCLNVGGAEGFIDVAGTNGTGFPFVPTDGAWGGSVEAVYADIPLSTIANLSTGSHTIIVHGKEAVGVWGATSTAPLVIDRTVPTISSATLAPSTIALGAASVTLNVTASDASGIVGAQYWIDGSATPPATPTAFTGNSRVIDTSALTGATHTLYVRVQDGASNWSAVSSVSLIVVQAVADTKSFNAPGGTGTQTQSYNSTGASLLANDSPTNASAVLVSAPIRIAGGGTVIPTLSCPGGGGNTAATPSVGSSTICTNGRFNVNMATPAGATTNGTRAAGRRGTYTFTYRITSGGVPSAPATVTINVN